MFVPFIKPVQAPILAPAGNQKQSPPLPGPIADKAQLFAPPSMLAPASPIIAADSTKDAPNQLDGRSKLNKLNIKPAESDRCQ